MYICKTNVLTLKSLIMNVPFLNSSSSYNHSHKFEPIWVCLCVESMRWLCLSNIWNFVIVGSSLHKGEGILIPWGHACRQWQHSFSSLQRWSTDRGSLLWRNGRNIGDTTKRIGIQRTQGAEQNSREHSKIQRTQGTQQNTVNTGNSRNIGNTAQHKEHREHSTTQGTQGTQGADHNTRNTAKHKEYNETQGTQQNTKNTENIAQHRQYIQQWTQGAQLNSGNTENTVKHMENSKIRKRTETLGIQGTQQQGTEDTRKKHYYNDVIMM